MRTSTHLLFCMLLLFLVACSKNSLSVSFTESQTGGDVISVDEALNSLESFWDIAYGKTKTGRRLYNKEDIQLIKKHMILPSSKAVESSLPDTLLYLLNFENNSGFAVLSATRKLPDRIYAVTESGSMTAEDITKAYQLLNDERTKVGDPGDSTCIVWDESLVPALLVSAMVNGVTDPWIIDPGDDEPGGGNPIHNTIYGPFVHTKWCQSAPFNNSTPDNAPAGCVAIATAQIMVCNKLSNIMYYDGTLCSWNDLESVYNYTSPFSAGTMSAQEQAAAFAYELGKSYNCYVRYNQGSWAVADGAKRTLENYGYSNVHKYIGFGDTNKNRAITMLSNQKPVYLGGCPSGTLNDGHAWVLDGYFHKVNGDVSLRGEFFHINWGWHGAMDGYYACGVFSTTARVMTSEGIDAYTASLTIPDPQNYVWTYRMITYDLN